MADKYSMDNYRVFLSLCSAFLCFSSSNCSPLYQYLDGRSYRLSDPFAQIDFPFPIYFSGLSFQKAQIQRFGAVEFHFNDSSTSNSFSHRFNENTERHFIAPFFMYSENSNLDPARIYVRSVSGKADSFMHGISNYIQTLTINNPGFQGEYALLVTWENMTDIAETVPQTKPCNTDASACKRNTFQSLLVANREQTFVIFSYEKMELPSSSETYYAGFNGGMRNGWTSVVEHGDNDLITKLNMYQGSDTPGRYIIEIGKDVVVVGGCRDRSLAGRVENSLVVYPKHSSILGGRVITLQGGCLQPGDIITCSFADVDRRGFYVSESKLTCVTPMMTMIGDIDLVVSVSRNTQDIYTGSTKFVINMASREGFPIRLKKFSDGRDGWNETKPTKLGVEWDPNILTTDPSALVDLKLIGYRETLDKVIWQPIRILGQGILNSDASYTFNPSTKECMGQICTDFEIAVLELKLQNRSLATNYRSIHKGALPLGWFTNSDMIAKYGTDWPATKCKAWYEDDRRNTYWIKQLLSCPCNLQQAMADFGRFQADPSCSLFLGSKCTYHIGAVHCVRSIQPVADAGNQCCYTADGLLRFSEDSYQGSTPDRSHDWGTAPYAEPTKVPQLSHWLQDVVTFYYCCLWTGYRTCDYYMDARPTRDCSSYVPPKSAVAYGDPHIGTFDGVSYNFEGMGDFTLLKCSTYFELQGKFSMLSSAANMGKNATALTSVAVRESEFPTGKIEIRLRGPKTDRRTRLLDVLVNGEYKYFDTPSMGWQDFSGASIVYNDNTHLHDNFTIMVKTGIGIQVAESNGLLQVICNVPPSCQGQTTGLFGTWDDDPTNDFTNKQGDVIPQSATQGEIYKQFGVSWNLSKSESFFTTYDPADNSFQPLLSTDLAAAGSSVSQSVVIATCGDNVACQFDYYVTGNEKLARTTLNAHNWHATFQNYLSTVQSCPFLSVPHSIKDNYNYSLGSTITITGCRQGKVLSGSVLTSTCVNTNGSISWDPTITAECSDDDVDAASIGTIVGITVPVVLVFIIIVVIIVVVRMRKRQPRHQRNTMESARPNSSPVDMPSPNDSRYVEYKPAANSEETVQVTTARRPSNEVTI